MQEAPESTRSRRQRAPIGGEATCSARVILPFARYLASIGCDAEAMLARHGLDSAMLRDRDRRIPHLRAAALLDESIALSGDPAIALRAVRFDEPDDFDVIGYAAARCASVGEALALATRFIGLMHDGLILSFDVSPPVATLRVRGAAGLTPSPAGVEFLFASLLACGSRSIGHTTRPLRVDFTHAAPPDLQLYEEVFREVRFGCDLDTMWIAASALDRPHCAPDRGLLQILTHHADGRLRQLARPPAFTDRARSAIAETLLTGHACADQVARRLAVSLRTLHRRLAEEGTSHGELIDDVRREQAKLHLAGRRFSIGEIAFLLGFAHPNGFHKAFKRWTRMTPAQYRDTAQSTAIRK